MSEYAQQLRNVCAFNRRLAKQVTSLERKLRSAERRLCQAAQANANLATERDAIDAALGAAMDDALKARRQ